MSARCFLIVAATTDHSGVQAEVIVADNSDEALGKFIGKVPAQCPVTTENLVIAELTHVVPAEGV
jgi:hypothetical protein